MPSKLVVDRQKSANAVVAAGRTHAVEVAGAAELVLIPHVKGKQKVPDVRLLIELAASALEDVTTQMVEADEAHIQELSDDDAPRQARDEAVAALATELVDLREWLRGLYGAGLLKTLGFSEATPRDPVALSRFASEVVKGLQGKALPAPKRSGVSWDAKEATKKLTTMREALDKHVKDVAREGREAEATLVAKNNAVLAYDERFSKVANFYAGIFRLAGKADLADRVRPSARRPGQTEAEAPSTEGDAGAAPPEG